MPQLNNRIAVYAGTFDIFTYGHIQTIREGLNLFDEIIVAIGNNNQKSGFFFSPDQRKRNLDQCLDPKNKCNFNGFDCIFQPDELKRIRSALFSGFLVDFCIESKAGYYLRGIRNATDFEYELNITDVNDDLKSIKGQIPKPVWIPSDRSYRHISSSMVRGLIGYPGWEAVVNEYVPPPVIESIIDRLAH